VVLDGDVHLYGLASINEFKALHDVQLFSMRRAYGNYLRKFCAAITLTFAVITAAGLFFGTEKRAGTSIHAVCGPTCGTACWPEAQPYSGFRRNRACGLAAAADINPPLCRGQACRLESWRNRRPETAPPTSIQGSTRAMARLQIGCKNSFLQMRHRLI